MTNDQTAMPSGRTYDTPAVVIIWRFSTIEVSIGSGFLVRFSQRKGFTPTKDKIQLESMDDALRNALWNCLCSYFWDTELRSREFLYRNEDNYILVQWIWTDYFKLSTDLIDSRCRVIYGYLRKYFYECQWYAAYDFIEFMARLNIEPFIESCNNALAKEMSGYRLVNNCIVDITSDEELQAIDLALRDTTNLAGVNNHVRRALELLSDRKMPDWRNSIKESISAIEAICVLIDGNPKATLGQALNRIEKASMVNLHPALKEAFSKLYGYTSDADGIRHSLTEAPTIESEDAKFMLVACSAFINYLLPKVSRAGITL